SAQANAAAEFKARIEGALAQKGLAARVKIERIGNTLTVEGRLRPPEHRVLLALLRTAPSSVRVVDDVEYDATPAKWPAHGEGGEHPAPQAGLGAIHVVTDVIGAKAVLRGPAGRELNSCDTPCSFNDLAPKRYSLEVHKEGYRPVQTALEVRAGDVIDQ